MGSLNINGRAVAVQADPDMPLLWVLALRTRHDRHQVRLWRGHLRRVHDSSGWRRVPGVSDADVEPAYAEDHDYRRRAGCRSASAQSRVDRSRRGAVRLLPKRTTDGGQRAAQAKTASNRCRYRRGDEQYRVPLRHVSAGAGGDSPGGGEAAACLTPPWCAERAERAERAQFASISTTATTAVKMPMQPPNVTTPCMKSDIRAPESAWLVALYLTEIES